MNLLCATSSNGAKVKDVAAVRALVEGYRFEVEPDEKRLAEGFIGFWGYETFTVYHDEFDDDECAQEFFERLQPLLAETLVVQCVGHEGLRFPLVAYQVTVPPVGPVKWDAFDVPQEVVR